MAPQNVVCPLPENTRRGDVLTPATTGMDLEDRMLGETSRSQKDRHCITPLVCVGSLEDAESQRQRPRRRGSRQTEFRSASCRSSGDWLHCSVDVLSVTELYT